MSFALQKLAVNFHGDEEKKTHTHTLTPSANNKTTESLDHQNINKTQHTLQIKLKIVKNYRLIHLSYAAWNSQIPADTLKEK